MHNKHETGWSLRKAQQKKEKSESTQRQRRKTLRRKISAISPWVEDICSKTEQRTQKQAWNIPNLVPNYICSFAHDTSTRTSRKRWINACPLPSLKSNIEKVATGANICHLCHVTSTLNLHHRKKPLYWQLQFQHEANKSQRTKQWGKIREEEKRKVKYHQQKPQYW